MEAGQSVAEADTALGTPMRLTVRILGAEVLHISTDPDPRADEWANDRTGVFTGFNQPPGLPIREPGRDLT